MTDFKERQKIVWQNMFYSIQRIDLLIISISGAGIYLCLETLKFMFAQKMEVSISLKVSACFFVAAIAVNFFSQFFSYRSNYYDYLYCIESGKEFQDDDTKKKAILFDDKSERITQLTNYSNYASAGLMFVGLILCLVYFITSF